MVLNRSIWIFQIRKNYVTRINDWSGNPFHCNNNEKIEAQSV